MIGPTFAHTMTKLLKTTITGVAAVAMLSGPVIAAVTPLPPAPERAADGKKEATINLEVTGMR